MKIPKHFWATAVLGAAWLSWSASAGTIGYWRFESNVGADSSGAGRDLTADGVPVVEALPAFFPTKIPRTGAANTSCLRLDGASFLYRAHEPGFTVTTQLTVEVFFNNSVFLANNARAPLVAKWNEFGTGSRSWLLAVTGLTESGTTVQRLRFGISKNGTSTQGAATSLLANVGGADWVLQTNRDYYAAMVYNAGTVTCYLADLSAARVVLQSQVITTNVPTSIFDSPTDVRIGAFAYPNETTFYRFNGRVDEVRVSDKALDESELLFFATSEATPAIDTQPQSLAVAFADNATFSVKAGGAPPLRYQWYWGTTPISGATNSTLTLTNIALSQAGSYSVVVTNGYGSVTSAPALLTVVDTSKPTVGYWRFENDSDLGLDTSGGGRTLSLDGSPMSDLIPAGFPGVIPLTAQTNLRTLSVDGASHLYRTNDLYFDSTRYRFTIEACFAFDTLNDDTSHPMASHWSDMGNQKGWVFAVREDLSGFGMGTPRLRVVVSQDGGAASVQSAINATKWALEPNHPYYAAAVYDAGTLTFYLADLAVANPVLESQTFSGLVTNVFGTTADFRIGAFGLSSATSFSRFFGKIDEVRLSNRALSAGELLFSKGSAAAPQLLQQPLDFAALEANDARFSIVASGTPAPKCQWYAGANPMGGATNETLTLTNLTLSQSGLYSVVLSNSSGSVTSALARLTVVARSKPTLGYWRFESPAQPGLDSSGNSFDLSAGGSIEPLTVGNAGGAFPNPLSLTGQPNLRGLRLLETNLSRVAWPWVPAQLTVEAFFNLDTFGDARPYPLACQWDELVANSQGWLLGVALSSSATRLQFRTSSGTATANKWTLNPGNDYYGAAVYDQGTVTFYLADLNSPEWLTDHFVDSQTVTGLGNSLANVNAKDLRIGGYRQAGFPYNGAIFPFNGLVDEVRVSQAALRPSELLVARNAGTFTQVTRDPASHEVRLTAQGSPGITYTLLRSTNLGDSQGWTVMTPAQVADANGLIKFTDPAPPAAGAFYRLRLP
jgi:hypothetical protein